MTDCLFCKIISGEIPCYKIFENDYCLAFLDISKDCYGHTLVIPKVHCDSIFDCEPYILAETIKTTQSICKHFKSLGFDGANIINNNGASAEQSIHHLHFHIYPRKENDGIKITPVIESKNLDLESIQKFLFKKS